jgi:hypothetical protein
VSDPFRVYFDPAEIIQTGDKAGYPFAWHGVEWRSVDGGIPYLARTGATPIKDIVREQAGHRCVRCGHPYRKGEHGNGEWSPCDEKCRHPGPVRWQATHLGLGVWTYYDGPDETIATYVEAQWRILTVHHLNGIKHDCRWWNLASLCQRCHLTIQGKVWMERVYDRPHSEWFKPYAAGWYAFRYLGEELTREETMARLDELLDLELRQERLFPA